MEVWKINFATKNQNDGDSKTEVKELTEYEKMLLSIASLMKEGLVFDTGDYIKGEIPAGEYAFVKFGGSGS